jgi:hypothetical protein
MENLIKLHKAQLASDRMSCHSATANQVRLVLHTAAFWLMHGVRAAIPQASPLAKAEFTTMRAFAYTYPRVASDGGVEAVTLSR